MAKIPFDIKFRPKIESGEYKVETSFGEPVEIVKWDCKGKYPLLACIDDGDCDDTAFYTEDGKAMSPPEISYLVLVTPESELSEFEEAVGSEIFDPPFNKEQIKVIKEESTKLLELARQELTCQGNIVLSIEDFEKHYVEAQEKGRKDDLKDLPKWKKYREAFGLALIPYALFNDGLYNLQSGYSISFSDLEKLPKED